MMHKYELSSRNKNNRSGWLRRRQSGNAIQVAEAKAAILLAEAEAKEARRLAEIHHRNNIQMAEANAAHEAQVKYIRQIESQRTAMTPMTNPGVQTSKTWACVLPGSFGFCTPPLGQDESGNWGQI
jgi:hypothetical protein